MAWPSEGVVADCNSGAMAASLLWSDMVGNHHASRSANQPDTIRQCLLLGHDRPHVGGLRALLALGDVELDGLPLVKRAVASRLDRAEMHEEVFAGFRGDEAVVLVRVEPLHGSNSHVLVPPSIILEVSTTPGPWWPGGKGQARPAGCEAKREPLRAHRSGCGDCPPPHGTSEHAQPARQRLSR